MNDPYRLAPAVLEEKDMHDYALREKASELVIASTRLESMVPPETAQALGESLRLLNSYHSNLIEGHKTYIPDIESAMTRKFSGNDDAKYAQELCAAHVNTERVIMSQVLEHPNVNVSLPVFLAHIHRTFYSHLPEEHRFTHEGEGFTEHPVLPGTFRDRIVAVHRGETQLGPEPGKPLEDALEVFGKTYDPARVRGAEEAIIASATGHLKLAWIHPFRDGNGRVARLYTGFYLARCGINKSNLWSMSRGCSHEKRDYMDSLWASNPQPTGQDRKNLTFQSQNVAIFTDFYLENCLGQVKFMEKQLDLRSVSKRIESYVYERRQAQGDIRPEAAKLLRNVFTTGALPREQVYGEVLNGLDKRTAQQLVSDLLKEGLVESKSSRAPLTIGLPRQVFMPYFPNLFNRENMGDKYADKTRTFAREL